MQKKRVFVEMVLWQPLKTEQEAARTILDWCVEKVPAAAVSNAGASIVIAKFGTGAFSVPV